MATERMPEDRAVTAGVRDDEVVVSRGEMNMSWVEGHMPTLNPSFWGHGLSIAECSRWT